MLLDEPVKNDLTALLLFTDGMANKGLLESSQITEAMKVLLEQMDSDKVATIFTFGYVYISCNYFTANIIRPTLTRHAHETAR